MLICPNPKCQKRHLKKYETEDGGYYYECGTCHYKTETHYNSNPNDTIIKKPDGDILK